MKENKLIVAALPEAKEVPAWAHSSEKILPIGEVHSIIVNSDGTMELKATFTEEGLEFIKKWNKEKK